METLFAWFAWFFSRPENYFGFAFTWIAVEIAWNATKPFTDWIGNHKGEPTYFKKTLITAFGWTLRAHCFVRADDPDCYHTHPSYAIRLVLWGGYIEDRPMWFPWGGDPRLKPVSTFAKSFSIPYFKHWRPGMIGFVRPSFCHRIHELPKGRSYSLWLHGPKVASIKLKGAGWPPDVTAAHCAHVASQSQHSVRRLP